MKKILMTRLSVCSLGNEMIDTPMLLVVILVHIYALLWPYIRFVSKKEQDAREAMRVVFFCTYKTYLYA